MIQFANLLIPAAVLLPNLLYAFWPAVNVPEITDSPKSLVYKIAEGVGRAGVMIAPLFSASPQIDLYELLFLSGMLIFLLLYYAGWARYLAGGREWALLFLPMAWVPVPMAVAPVLFFICASLFIHSPLLLMSGLILGAGHIPASLHIYRQFTESNKK
ncbi:hypothetical protein KIH86_27910 [Paenibacillus sp. HN-1]|uniref:hypothetical protein n=1 Tax=Paenibacillus TaxID=44249 RepID=UPI001CA83D21|nr:MULTISPECIES: hypothetical protein [Paenibacillus]MBY9078819.1 hypothetical protein [Paenibacillus sp. CGMCC 1.18879]MBY9088021.1 hypothetical protein [Paenibacillus sinensis]